MAKPICSNKQISYWFHREVAKAQALTNPKNNSKYLRIEKALKTGEEVPLKDMDDVLLIAYFNTLRNLNPDACIAWLNRISEQIKKARLS